MCNKNQNPEGVPEVVESEGVGGERKENCDFKASLSSQPEGWIQAGASEWLNVKKPEGQI